MFQSTLPRGERPVGVWYSTANGYVSIHAPTRGATQFTSVSKLVVWFQSTLPRGERRIRQACRRLVLNVSIHAPTRGATAKMYLCQYMIIGFNPRSHEGSDETKAANCIPRARFQSTLPRGERLQPFSKNILNLSCFNPRSHEGSDSILLST